MGFDTDMIEGCIVGIIVGFNVGIIVVIIANDCNVEISWVSM